MLKYYYFLIEGYKAPFGYVHKSLVQKMSWPEYWKIDHEKRFLTLTSARNFEQRTKLMEETLRCGIEIGSINPDSGQMNCSQSILQMESTYSTLIDSVLICLVSSTIPSTC